MFAECKNIIGIDFTEFISDEVTNMEYMFYNCKNLKYLNLLSFKTKRKSNMNFMFGGIDHNQTFDLSSFDDIKNKLNIFNIDDNDIWSLNYNNMNKEISDVKIDESYKIVFIGESGVGAKTGLINRIMENNFSYDRSATPSATYYQKKVILKNGKFINLDLWDTPGQEKYRDLTKIFMANSTCVILGFDLTNERTLFEIKQYWYLTAKNCSGAHLMYLIGNKIDKDSERAVYEEEARNFEEKEDLRYFEISCKTGEGIPSFFNDLISQIVKIKNSSK